MIRNNEKIVRSRNGFNFTGFDGLNNYFESSTYFNRINNVYRIKI